MNNFDKRKKELQKQSNLMKRGAEARISELEEQLQASRNVCRRLQIELVEALAELQEKK